MSFLKKKLQRLTNLIKENNIATQNLIKAFEAGKAADIIYSQIEKNFKS